MPQHFPRKKKQHTQREKTNTFFKRQLFRSNSAVIQRYVNVSRQGINHNWMQWKSSKKLCPEKGNWFFVSLRWRNDDGTILAPTGSKWSVMALQGAVLLIGVAVVVFVNVYSLFLAKKQNRVTICKMTFSRVCQESFDLQTMMMSSIRPRRWIITVRTLGNLYYILHKCCMYSSTKNNNQRWKPFRTPQKERKAIFH